MSTTLCKIETCNKPALARGWCSAHHARWLRHGDVDAGRPVGVHSYKGKVCTISGCENPIKARGMCPNHYRRWYQANRAPECTSVGCDKPSRTRGLCSKHYRIFQMDNLASQCSVDTCRMPALARGLCSGHLRRFTNSGSVGADRPLRAKASAGDGMAFILAAIENEDDGCILWPYGCSLGGYGAVQWQGVMTGAHRVTLAIHDGLDEIPPPEIVCRHSCHNRPCIQPRHLSWGSHQENSDDMSEAGRQLKGEEIDSSKLTERQVRAIRADDRSNRLIAAEYGVTSVNISKIKRRVSWAWLD